MSYKPVLNTNKPVVIDQRELTEKLLLSALRASDDAEHAENSLAHSEFLGRAAQLVRHSLSLAATREAIAASTLPVPGTWCVVDLVEADGSFTRLPIVSLDPKREALLREVGRDWQPRIGDPIGIHAIKDDLAPSIVGANRLASALTAAAHSDDRLQLLQDLNIGAMLTIPMVNAGKLLGAMIFISAKGGSAYTIDEVRLAQKLATVNAEALDHATMYTEALLMREQAELATANKLRFLGNISHELRTPLNAIMAYVELLDREIHGPVSDGQRDGLNRIRLNQSRMLRLVNDLLVFVQSGTSRKNDIVRIAVDDAVHQALTTIENMMIVKSITYEHHAITPDLIALGDEQRVNQILVNLLANAVKFTMRGGSITTECTATKREVIIRVIDTGIGIEPSKIEQIFEPFVQATVSPAAEGGVGLGLAIGRDLARSMGGDLSVVSNAGKGSCFTLSLPRPLVN